MPVLKCLNAMLGQGIALHVSCSLDMNFTTPHRFNVQHALGRFVVQQHATIAAQPVSGHLGVLLLKHGVLGCLWCISSSPSKHRVLVCNSSSAVSTCLASWSISASSSGGASGLGGTGGGRRSPRFLAGRPFGGSPANSNGD